MLRLTGSKVDREKSLVSYSGELLGRFANNELCAQEVARMDKGVH